MSLAFYSSRDLDADATTLAEGDAVTLAGAEGHHAATVKRHGVGDRLVLTDGQGLGLCCRVEGVGAGRLSLRVTQVHRPPALYPSLVLVQALAKGGRDLQAVESAIELGTDRVVPWAAQRAQVKWGSRAPKQYAKWVNQAQAAAKQSRRLHWPQVDQPLTTAQLTQAIAQRPAGETVFVAYEGATMALSECLPMFVAPASMPVARPCSIWVIVGPEGGITPAEIEQLRGAGAQPVGLGPTILRASSAGPAALAVIAAHLGRWRHQLEPWLRDRP